MSETRRHLEAARALSRLLTITNVAHAFHGSILTAVFANLPQSDEIFCIVEGGQGQAHPFRRVRDSVAGNDGFSVIHSPWTNRLYVSYRLLIPSIEIEILPAGEAGPRRLDHTTIMRVQSVPFLTVSEFIRAKLKSWMIGGSPRDAQDIVYTLSRHWNMVDINRIPETDMNLFVSRNTSVSPAWFAIKRKYGI
ncbi:hypothetical protein E1B28_005008 [Marasmius oreades]|uniref:Uncharacterized protein n=1 Tax=Marasmius oreades TaxID=181124 RepID=A0A9P7UZW1_9AGAR|nr:uncharacterized protein E1B28_005008 [Marasmius oreades]KAG7097683.1 hypothetical protein E1B28_005008 [Marasmius oreades]